jgi:hypothetical protein
MFIVFYFHYLYHNYYMMISLKKFNYHLIYFINLFINLFIKIFILINQMNFDLIIK